MLEAKAQFGDIEQPIDHIVAPLDAVIDEAGSALAIDQEQRRCLADPQVFRKFNDDVESMA